MNMHAQLLNLPKFRVTDHARLRLKERINIHDKKIPQLLKKAWLSTDDFSSRKHRKEFNSVTFKEKYGKREKFIREIMGHTFVFMRSDDGAIVLVTFI